MGRRKIEILPIQHDRNRSVTFLKRKNGLFKKAYELGVLCSVDVAVIIFGHNNKVYEYCSTDSDTIVQRRLHYTGERDVKTPADFGGDKAGNDEDDDGSDDPLAGSSRLPISNGKYPVPNKKRTRDDEPAQIDYTTPGHLLHLQQASASNSRTPLPNISSMSRNPPPVSLPLPPYNSIQPHQHQPSQSHHAHSADALMDREREREREREGALRQLGLQHLLNSSNPQYPPSHQAPNSNQFPPHPSHPSLVPNFNLASLLQAHPLLGLGVPGLNLGLSGLLGLNNAGMNGGGGGGSGASQQDLLAMLSTNAANLGGGNALYSNPLFSTLFPNHPGLNGDNIGNGNNNHSNLHGSGESKSAGGDLWPSLGRGDSGSAPNSVSAGGGGGGAGSAGDTSWLSFLGNPRGSQPPSDDVDLSSLFPFDTSGGGPLDDADDQDERSGKRAKR